MMTVIIIASFINKFYPAILKTIIIIIKDHKEHGYYAIILDICHYKPHRKILLNEISV